MDVKKNNLMKNKNYKNSKNKMQKKLPNKLKSVNLK